MGQVKYNILWGIFITFWRKFRALKTLPAKRDSDIDGDSLNMSHAASLQKILSFSLLRGFVLIKFPVVDELVDELTHDNQPQHQLLLIKLIWTLPSVLVFRCVTTTFYTHKAAKCLQALDNSSQCTLFLSDWSAILHITFSTHIWHQLLWCMGTVPGDITRTHYGTKNHFDYLLLSCRVTR